MIGEEEKKLIRITYCQFGTQKNTLNSTLIPHSLPYIFFEDLRIYIQYIYICVHCSSAPISYQTKPIHMCTLGAGKRNRNTEEIASELLTNGEQSYEKDKKEK